MLREGTPGRTNLEGIHLDNRGSNLVGLSCWTDKRVLSLIKKNFFFFKILVMETFKVYSLQFNSVAQSCPTLCDPMNCSMPGLHVHQNLLESTQTHVHRVSDAIQSSHPLSSPFSLALNLSQHQGLCKWVNSSHQVAKVLELQLQHQSFQWIFRTNLL